MFKTARNDDYKEIENSKKDKFNDIKFKEIR